MVIVGGSGERTARDDPKQLKEIVDANNRMDGEKISLWKCQQLKMLAHKGRAHNTPVCRLQGKNCKG